MAKKAEPPKPTSWQIDTIASKGVWLGEVEAPDEAAAIEKAAAEFKVPANRLIAIRAARPPEPPDAAPYAGDAAARGPAGTRMLDKR